ncbi:MAG: TonB-dependent receptor [Pseudohongiellaceae bacterium]
MLSSIRSFRVRALVSAVSAATFSGLPAFSVWGAEAHDGVLDEIIVTSSLQRSRAETALPVNVLSGEALREKAASTLGETLKELVGVNSSSFGTGVGLPVIRGQSGNRVQVLQGGVSNMDASAVSPDHANSVEAALAERIEVLRGPATLLYGNGAIGGVVNVIDNRIPTSIPDGVTGLVETRHSSASDQQTSVFKLDGAGGQLAWHLDGTYRDSNDTRINGFAINPATVDIGDEEALEELLGSRGEIDNSSTRAHAVTGGLSWIFDTGYLGMAVSRSESDYGLPAAAHHHHEDEDEHDEEAHDDEGADEHVLEGGIRIAMKQERLDFEGRTELGGFFEDLQGKVSVVDYRHAEIESSGEVGTVYSNEGVEGRFSFAHTPRGNLSGVTGLQFGEKTFSALGEEAYIPETDTHSYALFSVQSIEAGDMIYEMGLRAEHQHFEQSGGSCNESTDSLSGSASGLWRARDDLNVLMSVAHSQRAPTIEELYSNIDNVTCAPPADDHDLIAHAATQRLEIGDPNADKEISNNIEIGLRRHLGAVTGELNVFYNDIRDYLYMRDTGVLEDDVEIARLTQEDAVFRGVEAEVSMPLSRSNLQQTRLTLFGDYVRADFDRGGDVPRIPALRYGAEISHVHEEWQYKVRATRVAKQSNVAVNESETDGYVLVNVSVDYHAPLFGQDATVFGKISNLLDERVRNHTSLLKDVAPEAGRSVEFGLRYEF